MPDNTQEPDKLPDPDKWVEGATIALGMLFGGLLILMGLDALRRMRAIDREYDDVGRRLTVITGGADDAA